MLGWGDFLTPTVAAAVPVAMARVLELLDRWNGVETGFSVPDGAACGL